MRGKHLDLIKLLESQKEWMTAKQISKQIQVSERSVKNYIGEINYQEENLIIASKKGYKIDGKRALTILENQKNCLPETSEERINYIISELLSANQEQGVDLYDISERIYVSFETLRKDLTKIRKIVKEYGLYASVTNSIVTLEGKELNKRRLLSKILYEEFNQNFVSLELIQKAFPNYDIKLLEEIILDECKKNHYYINDYAMMNLILDVSISMERIKKNCTFRTHAVEKREFGRQETKLVQDIAYRIEESFGVSIQGVELQELTALVLSHLMKIDVNTLRYQNISTLVPPRSLEIVKKILEYLNENYYIDTTDENFMVKFAVHIHNLLLRMENQYTVKNPLTEHIKNTCPLIFECAVGVANCLNQMTGYRIAEDEIAYIAIHIGGNLDNYEEQKEKVSCILVCPEYYDMSTILTERINSEFSGCLTIWTVLADAADLTKMKTPDLIISTTAVPAGSSKQMIMVNPFLRLNDLEQIRKAIIEIQRERKRNSLKKALKQMTSSKLFVRNPMIFERRECLEFMVSNMEQNGYVDSGFIKEVERREQHSSTAFGRLAVPHAMELNAKKTGIYILISDKGVKWGKQNVNLVLLFAVNREDRAIFHEVFDNLIVLLLDNENMEKIILSTDYEEFIEALMSCE